MRKPGTVVLVYIKAKLETCKFKVSLAHMVISRPAGLHSKTLSFKKKIHKERKEKNVIHVKQQPGGGGARL